MSGRGCGDTAHCSGRGKVEGCLRGGCRPVPRPFAEDVGKVVDVSVGGGADDVMEMLRVASLDLVRSEMKRDKRERGW